MKQFTQRLTALLFVLMMLFSPLLDSISSAEDFRADSSYTITAKSKKKKNSSTATPKATKTPRPTRTPEPETHLRRK